MRAPLLAAFGLLLAAAGANPAQAAWQDVVEVRGSTITTMPVETPHVSCSTVPILGLVWLRFSWPGDPNAIGYEVRYGLTGDQEYRSLQAHETQIDIYPGIGGSITVTRLYPGGWRATSAPQNYSLLFGVLTC